MGKSSRMMHVVGIIYIRIVLPRDSCLGLQVSTSNEDQITVWAVPYEVASALEMPLLSVFSSLSLNPSP